MQTQSAQIAHSVTSSSAAELYRLDRDGIVRQWDIIGPMINDVAERSRGRWTLPTIMAEILEGRWQLFVVLSDGRVRAVIATELYRELSGKLFCGIRFCTGETVRDWIGLLPVLEAWARDEGCAAIDGWCRKGWAKHLPDYTMSHVLLEREL